MEKNKVNSHVQFYKITQRALHKQLNAEQYKHPLKFVFDIVFVTNH